MTVNLVSLGKTSVVQGTRPLVSPGEITESKTQLLNVTVSFSYHLLIINQSQLLSLQKTSSLNGQKLPSNRNLATIWTAHPHLVPITPVFGANYLTN